MVAEQSQYACMEGRRIVEIFAIVAGKMPESLAKLKTYRCGCTSCQRLPLFYTFIIEILATFL